MLVLPIQQSKTVQRVKRQLLEAILFENIMEFEETQKGEDTLFTLKGAESTYQCVGRRSAFGRIRLTDASLIKKTEDREEVASIEEFVHELPASAKRKQTLLNELVQTVLLSEWNESFFVKPISRRALPYEQLEAALIEGHPYHPCYKARTGFTEEDHYRYGPEAEQPFSLVWLGVRKEDVKIDYPEEEHSFLQRELGLSVWQEVVKTLCKKGGQLYEYRLVPIHPWQWNALKNKELQEAIAKKEVLYLGRFGDAYSATQSLRTVMNKRDEQKAQMKLPLNVVNTSSVRTIDPHLIAAAPHISTWLKQIFNSDPFLKEDTSVDILEEYAGVFYEPTKKPWHGEVYGKVGCIWRESVVGKVKDGEQAIPFNALPLLEEDGRLFIAPYLDTYGVDVWLRQLVEVAVIPVLHLLAKHGIALEAHAQNMVLVLENGWPKRVILRDFHESIEYYEPFVKDQSMIPAFKQLHQAFANSTSDQHYWMSSIEALRELLIDTLFVYHLTELSWQLEVEHDYKEEAFWSLVNQAVDVYVEKELAPKERVQALGLKAPVIYTESLFTRKVTGIPVCRHFIVNELEKESCSCSQ